MPERAFSYGCKSLLFQPIQPCAHTYIHVGLHVYTYRGDRYIRVSSHVYTCKTIRPWVKINPSNYGKIKAQKQELAGISFYFVLTSLPDAADAYTEMRLIVGNEAHLRRKSIHCFLNSCASPKENISMFDCKDQHHFSTSVNRPDEWEEHKVGNESCELLKSVRHSPLMPINRAMYKG